MRIESTDKFSFGSFSSLSLSLSLSLSWYSLGQRKIDQAFKCHRRTGRVQRNNRSVPVFRSPSPSRDLASSSGSPPFTLSPRATDPELKPRYGSRDTINARDIKLFAIVSPLWEIPASSCLLVSPPPPSVYSPLNKYPRTLLLISRVDCLADETNFASLVSRGNRQRCVSIFGTSETSPSSLVRVSRLVNGEGEQ